MRPSREGALWLGAAVIAGGLARIALAGRLPIGDDEAYYWLWSQHLAWSYPDHPPMIAAVVALSTHLFGDQVLGIRALTVLISTLTPLAIYIAGLSLFGPRAALLAALITAVIPAFAVGTVFAFPDAPLALLWALALWTGWRALQEGGWWWVATGAAVGLALLSKLTAFALLLGFAGALLAGGWRRALRDPGFYAGILVTAVLFAPVIMWNARHEWFLAHITLTREPWMTSRSIPENFLFFVGGQILYYGALAPVLVAAALAGLRPGQPGLRYLTWTTLPLLVAMTVAALDARPKPHWPGPAYLSAALALGALWDEWRRRSPRPLRIAAGLTVGTTAALLVGLLLPWGAEQVRSGIGGWDRLADAVDRHTREGGRVLVLTDTYQAASHLAYRMRSGPPVTTTYGAFALWQRPEWAGWSALYVDEPTAGRHLEIHEMCRNIRQVDQVELAPGRVVGLYRCEDVRFARRRVSSIIQIPHRAVSSVEERILHTDEVGGSKPSPPTITGGMK